MKRLIRFIRDVLTTEVPVVPCPNPHVCANCRPTEDDGFKCRACGAPSCIHLALVYHAPPAPLPSDHLWT